MQSRIHIQYWLLGFTIVVIVLFMSNLWYGSVLIPWSEVFSILSGGDDADKIYRVIVVEYRLPQAITALATGIALGVSGLLLQTIFKNPLAGPSVLGISSGASLGVALVVLMGGAMNFQVLGSSDIFSELGLVLAAFAGALIVLLIIIFVANRIGNVVTILIIGIMIGYAVSAIVGVLQFFSRSEELHAYVLWGLGSFSKTNIYQSLFLLISVVSFTGLTLFYIKPLNAILLGNNYARSVGINTRSLQVIVILLAGFLIAVATAFAGPIAFVGLAVPHLAKAFFQTSNQRVILPAVIIIGAGLTLFCNLIAKLPGYDTSLPINAVTSIIGAPVVIWVIVKRGRLKIS